jgi:SAM-dependent methyltransferase
VDIGSGAGVPAFELARLVGPEGHVTATDPSPAFIAALTDRSRELGLMNLDIVQTSAAALPFPSASFDAATCHFGVMFFPDVQAGLAQIRRVLRPGGRAAFVAWGPREQNSLFSPAFGVTARHLPPPPPPPGPISSFPNPMRFSEPGTLSAHLRDAGFDDVREDMRLVDLPWTAGLEQITELWTAMFRIREQAPPDQWDAIAHDFRSAYQPYLRDDTLQLSAPVVIASGAA